MAENEKPKPKNYSETKLNTYLISFGLDLFGSIDRVFGKEKTVRFGDIFRVDSLEYFQAEKTFSDKENKIMLHKMRSEFDLKFLSEGDEQNGQCLQVFPVGCCLNEPLCMEKKMLKIEYGNIF